MNTGVNEWMMALSLLKKGARWGDLEVFSIEENLEILTKPSKRDPPKLVTMIEKVRKPLLPTVPQVPKKSTFTEKLAQFSLKKKTSCMVQCTTCSFARNTTPPEHFTESQKSHCCAYCSMTGGQQHGVRCQQISM
jgi:hypothetical protein